MKKAAVVLFISLVTVTFASAQSIQEEAIGSLSTAQEFVSGGNYSKAIEEINYALAKINELTAEQLLKFVPEPPPGFTLINKQSQGIGAGAAIAGNAGATASYADGAGGTIDLNIAIGGMTGKMASLAALGSMFAGLGQDSAGGKARQLRVKGYTGTEMFNPNQRSGTLSFQVGNKTSVTLNGKNIDSAATLLQLAKQINFADLEKNF